MTLPHTEKLTSQKFYLSNKCVEAATVKSKNNQVKLQPLVSKVENNVLLNSNERKFSHRLNPLPAKLPVMTDQKKFHSKIPVLQRRNLPSKKPKNDNTQNDTSLSAADRRQKFHQSRLHAAGIEKTNKSVVMKQQNSVQYDLFPCNEGYMMPRFFAPLVPGMNLKGILPPIKPLEITTGNVQKPNQQKSKCLLGEITHFPALCNPISSKQRKKYKSTVPSLPPILPPPLAPPPSISTSLEKAGNQGKLQTVNPNNEELSFSKYQFYKLNAS